MRDVSAHIAGWLRLVGSLDGQAHATTRGGVTWSLTDIAWPMFNAGVAAPDADAGAVEQALEELRDTGLPWFWFVLPQTADALVERVLAAGANAFDERAPWMEIDRAKLPAPQAPSGVAVREASAEVEVRTWARTLQAAYEFPDAGRDAWIAAALRRAPGAPQFRLWTVLRKDVPVAITLGFVAEGVVGQFGVGVLATERRHGFGRLVTLVAPAELEAPVAGHWATPDGERLYESLGMTTNGWVTRYLGGAIEIPATAAGR